MITTVPTAQLRFSQSTISAEFGQGPLRGMSLFEVAGALRSGSLQPHPVKIFRKESYMDSWPMLVHPKGWTGRWAGLQNGVIYAANNRGLAAAALAALPAVPVRWLTTEEIVELSYQYDTPSFGRRVLVRETQSYISVA